MFKLQATILKDVRILIRDKVGVNLPVRNALGVCAQTQEQANGFCVVSIVLLAAIGGIMVPSFARPESFQGITKISLLHWCLKTYYDLSLKVRN